MSVRQGFGPKGLQHTIDLAGLNESSLRKDARPINRLPRVPLTRHWLFVDSERLSIGISHGQSPIRLPLRISRWLMDAYPGDEETRVSHETIYQSLFIQGKGALRKELCRCVQTLGSQEESGVNPANWSSWSGR